MPSLQFFLECPLIPGAPDSKGQARSLNIEKEGLSVRAEGSSGELLVFESLNDIFSEIEYPAINCQSPNELFTGAVLAKNESSSRADAEVVRTIEDCRIRRLEDESQNSFIFC